MMRIKSAILALKNRLLISMLLLIQFTFGLSTITGSVNVFYNLYYLSNNSSSVLDLNSTYLITFQMTTDRLKEDQFNKQQIEEIYNKIIHNKDVISYGTYYEDRIELKSSNRVLKNSMLADLTNKTFNDESPTISAITVDDNYYNLLNLQIKTGKGFSYQDFKNNSGEKTNILVGSYFKKYFHVGDTINNQYTIIGFLPENKFIVNNNTTNTYMKLDKAVLLPMPADMYENYGSMFTRLHHGTVLTLRKDADIKKLQETIQLKGDSVKLYLKHLGEDINQNVTVNSYSEIPQLVLGVLFILFSIAGIVVTSIVSIMMRKREFGIKMVLGESKYGIFVQIVLENIFIGIAGMGMSLAYFSWRYAALLQLSKDLNMASVLDFKLDVLILFLVFLFLLLIITVSNFIVFLFIRRLEPKSLIGGME